MFKTIWRFLYKFLISFNLRFINRRLLPHAACVLIENQQGQILVVSRKNDHTKWGLPGDKTDLGETDQQAAVRELYEETGLMIYSFYLRKFFEDTDDFEYWTVCYRAYLPYEYFLNFGEKAPNECGEVKWVEKEVLTSGIFGVYNTKLFEKVYHG